MVQLSYLCITIGKTIALLRWIFVGKVLSLLFSKLSRFVTAFFPRSKSLNFMAIVTVCSDFGVQENKTCHLFPLFPIYYPWLMGLNATISAFWVLSFKTAFHSALSPSSRGSLVPLCFLPSGWCHLYIWGCWISPSSLYSSLWLI